MGVPAFFKWLTLRYPKIAKEAMEQFNRGNYKRKIKESNLDENDIMPLIDNLYFDMNGIIHSCSHPEDREAPLSISEIFNSIFEYCDKIIRLIKPKKLIFMAIDGVAPRAKMNQQRSRRFRSAIDAEQKEIISKKIENEWKNKGLPTYFLDSKNRNKFKFDSNYITPGTEFLEECSIALKLYIKSRINIDPLWKNLNVIFSDSSVPGEGEHKILAFIRNQRTCENYDPNTSHCVYGADADLIMLSLIMHEPNFYVLRESITEKYNLICKHCGKHGHKAEECRNTSKNFNKNKSSKEQIYQYNKQKIDEIEFTLIKIGILREYLEIEFQDLIKLDYDLELIIDDFVFLCFLVGNDFLPNLPSLKIREGAIDALIYLYKNIRPDMENYLTNGKGQLNLKECEILFKNLSTIEDEFFKQEMEDKKKEERKKIRYNNISSEKYNKPSILIDFRNIPNIKNNNNKRNILNFKSYDEEKFDQIIKEVINEENNKKIEEYKDLIQLGKKGWKDRYYLEKFHMSPKNDKNELKDLKSKLKKYYIEGLCWVFEYYYNGCISWSWFYPFHYAPFASDLTDLNSLNINFNLGKPFMPFEQLLSVLPPYSAGALPSCFQTLMTDPFSPIADFYPRNIKLDINNQPFTWMGVNLLPFIEEEKIHKMIEIVLNKKSSELNEKQKKLNNFGNNILITASSDFTNFEGDIIKNPEIINYKQFEKDYNFIKDIQLEKIEKDETKNYFFMNKKNNKKHSSTILKGIIKQKINIIEYNPNNNDKNKFKGKQAIELVKRVLGFSDNVEEYIKNEIFDEDYNNNRAFEFEPKKKFLLQKRRFQENSRKKINFKQKNYRKRETISKDRFNDTNIYNKKRFSNRKKTSSFKNERDSHSRRNYSRKNKKNYPNIELNEDEDEFEYKNYESRRTKKKYYNKRFKK